MGSWKQVSTSKRYCNTMYLPAAITNECPEKSECPRGESLFVHVTK